MKMVMWNVNGYRSILKKNFDDFFNECNADIFSICETKMQDDDINYHRKGYYAYISSAKKKGYSGTLVYTKIKPNNVIYGIDGKYNDEGRVLTLEYDNFYYVHAYVPNVQRELTRLDYRMIFENDMKEFLNKLDKIKPVIYTGDLNVAHNEIDLKNPKNNIGNAGFTYEEREKLSTLLDSGFTDTFRYLYKEKAEYTWWSYMFNSRLKNIGWRIDYYLVSSRLENKIIDSYIYSNILGSDHAPIGLDINLD